MNEGRLEVGGIVAEAERALAESDAVRLAAAYASLARWTDPHRAHQARCLITDRVLAHRAPGAGWVPMFVTALRLLLDSLDRNPAEPVLLNVAISLAMASIHVCWAYMPAAAE